MISIIIPAFNEENYLPKLLESIKKQNYKDYEIIVADANSKDNTKSIAKRHGCKVIQGGLHAQGVNNGAKAAKWEVLLVLDADAVLPRDFLDKNFNAFRQNNLDVASCYIKPVGGKLIDRLTHEVANIYYFTFKKIRPYVPSFCFFVKRDLFLKIGGFDEKIPWLVDLAFSNALPKNAKYDTLPVHINLSVRMGERLGRLRQARIMFIGAFLRTIKRNYYGEYKWKEKEKATRVL